MIILIEYASMDYWINVANSIISRAETCGRYILHHFLFLLGFFACGNDRSELISFFFFQIFAVSSTSAVYKTVDQLTI